MHEGTLRILARICTFFNSPNSMHNNVIETPKYATGRVLTLFRVWDIGGFAYFVEG